MELEYNALSMVLQDVLPLKNLTKDIIRGLGQSGIKLTTFHKILRTIVHEENTGALKLANMEPGRMTPRSNHYGITKYHWFCEKPKPNEVHVGTLLQRTAFLTKRNRVTKFEENQKSPPVGAISGSLHSRESVEKDVSDEIQEQLFGNSDGNVCVYYTSISQLSKTYR